ncbi:hypothetical protein [Streptomyces chartreusis]|uniref:hypothetical protein n=1 Tax=Streptomyces chartreusis TaxID=1969 RepID=UPI0036623C05
MLTLPIAVAIFGIAFLALTVWCAVTVARMREVPTWRRFLPLFLILLAAGTSLLRAIDIPEAANLVAFPLNVVAVLLALREMHLRRRRKADAQYVP